MKKEFSGNFGKLIKDPRISSVSIESSAIYKYRSWENELHRSILLNSSIFMASADKFDDKNDFDYRVNWGNLNRWDWIKRSTNFLKRNGEQKNYANRIGLMHGIDNYEKCRNPDFVNEQNAKYRHKAFTEFGICSCCSSALSLEMWESYGSSFSGFCVGFNPELISQAGAGIAPVLYFPDNNCPEIEPSPLDDNSDFLSCILLKNEKYKFENEYRIWTHKVVNGDLKIPVEAIVEIIIGFRMKDEFKNEIVELRKKYKHAKFFEAKLNLDNEQILLTEIF